MRRRAARADGGECREAQARFLRPKVQTVVNNGSQAIITGDLNSLREEQPLERGGLLSNQVYREQAAQRYSFQFQEQLLVTPGLNRRFAAFQYAHFNIDYFERQDPNSQTTVDGEKFSVHDPPILTLNQRTGQSR